MFDKKEYMKEYCQREEVREHRREYNKQWRKDNREKKLEQNRRHYQKYKDRRLEEAKEYYQKNSENMLKKAEEYFQNNREKIWKYRREKYKTNINYNLNHKIRNGIRRSLQGKKRGHRWENLVGYTLEDLIKRLKSTMPKGYTWNDYLEGELQIDHIIPKSVFNYDRPEHYDFKRCWDLKNLRLLPAKENIIKSNHLERPFQPALKLCLAD